MTMTDEKKETLEKLGEVIKLLPESKREYPLGYGDALLDVRVDSSPPQDKIGDVAIRLTELAEEINRQIDRLVDLKQEATDLIDEIEDFRLRTLLYQYYVLNNTLEQTAVNMHLMFRGCRDCMVWHCSRSAKFTLKAKKPYKFISNP